jgi:SPP1 gp7 family putative phage head morphogenesis protein
VVDADDEFVGWYFRSGLHAAMAGQLMVRSVELAEEAEDGAPGTVQLASSRAIVRNDSSSFLGIAWEEAVDFFRGKRVMTPEEFDRLRDRYRAGAFTARKLASQAMRERALREIVAGLERGEPIEAIITAIDDGQAELGVEPASHAQLTTIVRNNISTSYGAGRLEAMTDPAVIRLRPFWQYWSTGDSRVREAHRELHGKVFEAGSETALYYTPPLGHNCRCSTTTLSRRQFEKRGLVLTPARIDGVDPDDGWSDPPAPLPPLEEAAE